MPKKELLAAAAVMVLLAVAFPSWPQEFLFTADIPVSPAGASYTPNQVVRRDYAGNFALFFDGAALGIPANVHITALAPLSNGAFIFAADVPFSVGGHTYLPNDVVLYSAGVFSIWQTGSALSIPPNAAIDALAVDSSLYMYYSFDVPVTIGSNTYQPDDIARVTVNSLEPFLSGSSDLGLPAGSDIVGFDVAPNGDYFFMFRTPTMLGGTTYLPSQIVRLHGGVWGLFWSAGANTNNVVATFTLPASPGSVPDGGAIPGIPLQLSKSGSNAHLTWGAACVTDADDYAIYRGALGSWYGHSSVVCTTGGATTADVAYGSGNEYYLVVPLNGTFEGSYGTNSSGAEIPAAAVPCRGYWEPGECP